MSLRHGPTSWIILALALAALGCGGGTKSSKNSGDPVSAEPTTKAPVDEAPNHVEEPLTDATSPCLSPNGKCGDTTPPPAADAAVPAPIPTTAETSTGVPSKGTRPGGKKPTATNAPTETPEMRATRVAHGAKIFDRYCDTCHPGGNADPDYGPKIRDLGWTVTRATAQIRNGKGKMKPISTAKISDADLVDLMAYLSTIRAVSGVPR